MNPILNSAHRIVLNGHNAFREDPKRAMIPPAKNLTHLSDVPTIQDSPVYNADYEKQGHHHMSRGLRLVLKYSQTCLFERKKRIFLKSWNISTFGWREQCYLSPRG